MNDEHCKFLIMKKSEDNLILVKSKAFALRIIRLYKYLCDPHPDKHPQIFPLKIIVHCKL